jgi:ribosomal protein L37E
MTAIVTTCRECGRPLYAGGRDICLSCMGATL